MPTSLKIKCLHQCGIVYNIELQTLYQKNLLLKAVRELGKEELRLVPLHNKRR